MLPNTPNNIEVSLKLINKDKIEYLYSCFLWFDIIKRLAFPISRQQLPLLCEIKICSYNNPILKTRSNSTCTLSQQPPWFIALAMVRAFSRGERWLWREDGVSVASGLQDFARQLLEVFDCSVFELF